MTPRQGRAEQSRAGSSVALPWSASPRPALLNELGLLALPDSDSPHPWLWLADGASFSLITCNEFPPGSLLLSLVARCPRPSFIPPRHALASHPAHLLPGSHCPSSVAILLFTPLPSIAFCPTAPYSTALYPTAFCYTDLYPTALRRSLPQLSRSHMRIPQPGAM